MCIALDTGESKSKEIWLVWDGTWVEMTVQVFLPG